MPPAGPSLPDWAIDPPDPPDQVASSSDAKDSVVDSTDENLDDFDTRPGIGLRIFQAIEFGTISTAVTVGLANILWLFDRDYTTTRVIFMRLFSVFFGTAVVMIEANLCNALEELSLFENWMIKGVFYAFIGVHTLSIAEIEAEQLVNTADEGANPGGFLVPPDGNEMHNPENQTSLGAVVLVTQAIGALVMIFWGAVYIAMGLTCRKQVKELMLIEYRLLRSPDNGRGLGDT